MCRAGATDRKDLPKSGTLWVGVTRLELGGVTVARRPEPAQPAPDGAPNPVVVRVWPANAAPSVFAGRPGDERGIGVFELADVPFDQEHRRHSSACPVAETMPK